MAFGSGVRPWVRGTLAKIAASTTVLGQGELLIDEAGGVYGGDGATAIKDLIPAAKAGDLRAFGIHSPLNYGAKADWNGTTGTDDSAAILAALTAAAGRPVYLPRGSYLCSIDVSGLDVHLVGPGKLIHQQGKSVIYCKRTLGASIPVTQGALQWGPNNPPSGTSTESYTKLTVGSGDYRGFVAGDVYHIASQDAYSWSASTGVGNTIYQTGFAPLLGVGLDVTGLANGGPLEGTQLTGATSGATALVQAVIVTGTTAQVLFRSVSASFVAGETLSSGGTTVGTAGGHYLVVAQKLVDSYLTSPVIRKVPTQRFLLDGIRIEASGNVDQMVGAANRKPAVHLLGVHSPVLRGVRVHSAWTRALRVESCWRPDIDVEVDRLPNDALAQEQAFGYGVELCGCTEGGRVKIFAHNVRHAVTTNVQWGGFQFVDPLGFGTIKHNTIYDSQAQNTWNAAFDSHNGAYFTRWENCRALFPASANRFQSGGVGFQNRGFGTTYRDCTAVGATVGFVEQAVGIEAGFFHTISFIDCLADSYQSVGYQMINNFVSNNAELIFEGCTARGDGSLVNAPYFQVGFVIRGVVGRLVRCTSERFNGAPYRFTDGGRVSLVDCMADYFYCPGTVDGLRVDATMGELSLTNYAIRVNPFGNTAPTAILRNAGGDTAWNIDGIRRVTTGSGGYVPQLLNITGGNPTVNAREELGSVRPATTRGDVGATLTPRSSSPTQLWTTPLTTDRTATLPTTPGLVINGDHFRVVRTAAATGASTLTVAGKVLAAGQWADVTFDGTAWQVTGSGSL